jgi:hypothetical protein
MTDSNLAGDVASSIRDSLRILVDGTIEDLEGVATEISIDLTEAMLTGRPDLAEHLAAQLQVLLAKKQIEVSKEATKAIRAMVLSVIRIAISALAAI